MFETLIKTTQEIKRKNSSPSQGSPKKQGGKRGVTKMVELQELQSQIYKHKPNNIMQFIRDWSNAKLNKNIKINTGGLSEDEQQINTITKNFERRRRFAHRINDEQINETIIGATKIQKLEETKSMILIIMKRMEVLKKLSDTVLWSLVQQFEQKDYKADEVIIKRKQAMLNLFIIISGSVICKGLNKKPIVLYEGCSFGQDSLLFSRLHQNDYICQTDARISQINGRIITKTIRQYNIEKYNIICKALSHIQYFNVLHDEEMDKVAEIAMNQQPIWIDVGESINLDSYQSSFFIVLQGLFVSFIRKLTQALRNEPSNQYKKGWAFGVQCIYELQADYVVICKEPSSIVEIKCSDIERVLGPLQKLSKRKKLRK